MKTDNFQKKIVSSLKTFAKTPPEIIFEWKDPQSNATGYLVINSLRGDVAGGGTRVHENINVHEITALAKTMEIKFALSGPSIGGAKSGIKIDPAHPKKYEILARWYKAIEPFLKFNYGTGADLNTDIQQINNILINMGIRNSQEAVIKSMHVNNENTMHHGFESMKLLQTKIFITNQLKIKLSELVTGFGVSESIRLYLQSVNDTMKDKKVFIQGVGNVGSAAAYFLHQSGAKIVALLDKDAGIFSKAGLSENDILNILQKRCINNVIDNAIPNANFYKALENNSVDIFVPAAASNVVSKKIVESMIANGLQIIACGANNPFIENDHCYGDCTQYIDKNIILLPDFLSSMGMARAFYKLGSSLKNCSSFDDVFNDISEIINQYIVAASSINSGTLMTASLYEIALKNLAL